MAAVLKTARSLLLVGSNPTPSAVYPLVDGLQRSRPAAGAAGWGHSGATGPRSDGPELSVVPSILARRARAVHQAEEGRRRGGGACTRRERRLPPEGRAGRVPVAALVRPTGGVQQWQL